MNVSKPVALALATLTLTPAALAFQGKGKGGGGGGGGSGSPPAPAILYVQDDPNETHLMVMDADGSNPTVVLANALERFSIGSMLAPEMAPDGHTIVFWSNLGGSDLCTIDLDGSGLKTLVPVSGGGGADPDWSPVPLPDGRPWIAYTDVVGGQADVFLVQPDGSAVFDLTSTPALDEMHPTWSPDSTRIAVIASGGAPYESHLLVYDIAAVGGLPAVTGVTDLSHVPGSPLATAEGLFWPEWSHDGTRIALAARLPDQPDNWDLWIVDVASPTTPANLTQTPGLSERMPSWSPDDSELVFWMTGSKKGQGLNVLRLDGSGTRHLGAKEGIQPRWFGN